MIQLTCTSCKTVLSIDDAFAGGVCRCQHCGTIQTVPSFATSKSRPASPTQPKVMLTPIKEAPPQPKALYQGPTARASEPSQPAQLSQGLNELAQAVQSSGLTGTGLRSGRLRREEAIAMTAPVAAGKDKKMMIVGGAAVAAVVVAIIAIIVAMNRGGGGNEGPSGGNTGGQAGNNGAVVNNGGQSGNVHSGGNGGNTGGGEIVIDTKTPNCMGLPLTGPSVIYLLDRGSGTVDTFDAIKGGTVKSLESMGKDLKFGVMFWEVRGKVEAYPENGLTYANGDNIGKAMETMRGVYAEGASSIEHPLEKAMAQNPAEIVIISGKPSLDDEFVNTVMRARGAGTAKIHTICTGAAGSPETLKGLARKAGGEFRLVDGPLLKRYADFTVN